MNEKILHYYKILNIILVSLITIFAIMVFPKEIMEGMKYRNSIAGCGRDEGYYLYDGKIKYCTFFNRKEAWTVRGVDTDSFEVLDDIYAKDKNNVYEYGKILFGTNPELCLTSPYGDSFCTQTFTTYLKK